MSQIVEIHARKEGSAVAYTIKLSIPRELRRNNEPSVILSGLALAAGEAISRIGMVDPTVFEHMGEIRDQFWATVGDAVDESLSGDTEYTWEP